MYLPIGVTVFRPCNLIGTTSTSFYFGRKRHKLLPPCPLYFSVQTSFTYCKIEKCYLYMFFSFIVILKLILILTHSMFEIVRLNSTESNYFFLGIVTQDSVSWPTDKQCMHCFSVLLILESFSKMHVAEISNFYSNTYITSVELILTLGSCIGNISRSKQFFNIWNISV